MSVDKELDVLKRRLLAIELAQANADEYAEAIRQLLFDLVLKLADYELLPMQAVIGERQSTAAFAQGAFDKQPNRYTKPLLDALQTIADAQVKFAQTRRPKKDEGG